MRPFDSPSASLAGWRCTRLALVQVSGPARRLPERGQRQAPRPPRALAGGGGQDGEGGPTKARTTNSNPYSKVYPRKATWEGTFGVEQAESAHDTRGGGSSPGIAPPWEVVGQVNESNLVWNDRLSEGLLKAVVSEKLGLEGAEMEGRINDLRRLIPEMAVKLPRMQATLVASLLEDPGKVARRLVQLKGIFPAANVSLLATRCPALLITAEENMQDVQAKAQKLRTALPAGVNVDKLVAKHPVEVLNVEPFLEAIAEAQRLVPSLDIPFTLENNPTQIFSFQRGSALIPYDDVKELW
mmetsp:Transcript_2740/g.6855  ORF Transcript_2740/g.6855 Transcript_2740/m.6855 type:complete len:298 (-) Transcript_2740:403-1296(-)